MAGIGGGGTDVREQGGLGGDRPSVRQDGVERRGGGAKGPDMMPDVRNNDVEHGVGRADFAVEAGFGDTVGKEANIEPGMVEVMTGVGMEGRCKKADVIRMKTMCSPCVGVWSSSRGAPSTSGEKGAAEEGERDIGILEEEPYAESMWYGELDDPMKCGADGENDVYVAGSAQLQEVKPTCELGKPPTQGRGIRSHNGPSAQCSSASPDQARKGSGARRYLETMARGPRETTEKKKGTP